LIGRPATVPAIVRFPLATRQRGHTARSLGLMPISRVRMARSPGPSAISLGRMVRSRAPTAKSRVLLAIVRPRVLAAIPAIARPRPVATEPSLAPVVAVVVVVVVVVISRVPHVLRARVRRAAASAGSYSLFVLLGRV
jgi:hypothetical protein